MIPNFSVRPTNHGPSVGNQFEPHKDKNGDALQNSSNLIKSNGHINAENQIAAYNITMTTTKAMK